METVSKWCVPCASAIVSDPPYYVKEGLTIVLVSQAECGTDATHGNENNYKGG